MNPTERTRNFVMLHLHDLERVFNLHSRRDLKPMDGLTFLALVSQISWSSGKAEVTSEQLGEMLGTDARLIRTSLSRLRKYGVVTMFRDKTGFFYSIHPGIVKAGRTDSRNLLIQQWREEGLL